MTKLYKELIVKSKENEQGHRAKSTGLKAQSTEHGAYVVQN